MTNLLSLSYWFNSRPESIGIIGQKALATIAVVLVIILIVILIKAYSKKLSLYKSSIDKLIPFCITNIIIDIYIFFVSYELVPVLRARIWYIIWIIISLWWLIVIIKDFSKKAKNRVKLAIEAQIKKYLP